MPSAWPQSGTRRPHADAGPCVAEPALDADTGITGTNIAREPGELVRICGKPASIVSGNGT